MSTHTELIMALCILVPVHEEMVDEQIVGMEKTVRMEGASPSRLAGINLKSQELRERFRMQLADALLGFLHSVGNAFYFMEKHKADTAGVCYVLTSREVFVPDVANALLSPYRMWPVSHPEAFLAHARDWYKAGVAAAPLHFRQKEWELLVDEAGELVIRLTGEREEVPPHLKRERAKPVRFKMGYRE